MLAQHLSRGDVRVVAAQEMKHPCRDGHFKRGIRTPLFPSALPTYMPRYEGLAQFSWAAEI